jgi:LAO/AO transport system kinase
MCSMVRADIDDLAARIRTGSVRAIARGLSWIEAGGERAEALSEALYPASGGAHVVGVTGAAGAGKSTLVRGLARVARARGANLAIIAVDPSSPFSGGAILGDRIRMTDIASDPGVFIRSVATRGAQGGLARGVADAVDLLAAAGKDLVIVETVGVGQDEVDVMRLALTTIVVSVPGLGDDIQAMKAGLLEIADIHVVNKADREGADRAMAQLRSMLAMTTTAAGAWQPPIVRCIATAEDGAAALLAETDRHWGWLQSSGTLPVRRRRIAQARVLALAQAEVARRLEEPIEAQADLIAAALEQVTARRLSPARCARTLLSKVSAAERVTSDV